MFKVTESDRNGNEVLTSSSAISELALANLVSQLRGLLEKEKKFCLRKDDEFLAKFIRIKNYDVERALLGIRSFHKFIEINDDISPQLKPTQFKELYDAHILSVLSGNCKSGSKMVIMRPGNWDTSKHSVSQIRQANVLLVSETIEDPQIQLNGLSIIVDLAHLTLSHLTQLTASELKRLFTNVQNGFPIKIASIHIINYPTIFWATFYIVQGFIKEKLKKRIHFHQNIDSLQEHFHVDLLPKYLNGPLELHEALDQAIYKRLFRQDKAFQEYYT